MPLGPILRTLITQVTATVPGNRTDHCAHPRLDIPTRRLSQLQVYIQDCMLPLRVELRHQCQQVAGLAGLARGVEDKVALLRD